MPRRRAPVSHLPVIRRSASTDEARSAGTPIARSGSIPILPEHRPRPRPGPAVPATDDAAPVRLGSLAPSARTILVTVLAIVAALAHLFVGVGTLLFLALTPDPGVERALLVFKVMIAAGWIGFLILIPWAALRRSFLVILVPIASAAWFLVVGSIAQSVAPGSLGIGP